VVREELVLRNVAALVKVSTPRARRTPPVWTSTSHASSLRRRACYPYDAAYVLMLVIGLRRAKV
jgi:hypothetical protein